jgi:hypothetical protein
MYYFEFETRIGAGLEDVSIEIRFDRDEDTTFDREVLSIEKDGLEISGCFSTEFLDELAKKGADLYMAEIACGERDV